jgi:DNA-binding transcriptional LysR family regulator
MRPIDLRLLSVFEAVHRSRSVSGAADILAISQPAVSVALAKLRHHFGDPLFVRTSAGMDPTPFAEGLLAPIRDALRSLDVVSRYHSGFDPATTERTFVIGMTDISQLVLLPRLSGHLRTVAPGIRIQVSPLSPQTGRMLENGEADLAMGFIPQLDAGFYQQHLFDQNFVCLVARDHPRIKGSLTLEQYQAEQHAVINSSGAAPLIIEREIARQGILRRVVLEIPNFLGAAFVTEHTDLVLTIPSRLGELLERRGSFRVLPMPFPLPSYSVKQHWHERFNHDGGNKWLRGLISELLAERG